jgi:hypothetical protein
VGPPRSARRLAARLERDGILLEHDAILPSATAIVVGEPVRGSWWAHPQAHEIYDGLQPLHERATRVKLIAGKATLVHRRLWPALVAVGRSRQTWQLDGLTPAGTEVLATMSRRRRPVWADEAAPPLDNRARQATVRELERRLLIHTDEVHTETGAHRKTLETWSTFRRRYGVADPIPSATDAKREFEAIVAAWPNPERRTPLLPWRKQESHRRLPASREE